MAVISSTTGQILPRDQLDESSPASAHLADAGREPCRYQPPVDDDAGAGTVVVGATRAAVGAGVAVAAAAAVAGALAGAGAAVAVGVEAVPCAAGVGEVVAGTAVS